MNLLRKFMMILNVACVLSLTQVRFAEAMECDYVHFAEVYDCAYKALTKSGGIGFFSSLEDPIPEMVLEISHLPLEEQKEIIFEAREHTKGYHCMLYKEYEKKPHYSFKAIEAKLFLELLKFTMRAGELLRKISGKECALLDSVVDGEVERLDSYLIYFRINFPHSSESREAHLLVNRHKLQKIKNSLLESAKEYQKSKSVLACLQAFEFSINALALVTRKQEFFANTNELKGAETAAEMWSKACADLHPRMNDAERRKKTDLTGRLIKLS